MKQWLWWLLLLPYAVHGQSASSPWPEDARIPVPGSHYGKMAKQQNRVCRGADMPPAPGSAKTRRALIRGMGFYLPEIGREEVCLDMNRMFKVVE